MLAEAGLIIAVGLLQERATNQVSKTNADRLAFCAVKNGDEY